MLWKKNFLGAKLSKLGLIFFRKFGLRDLETYFTQNKVIINIYFQNLKN